MVFQGVVVVSGLPACGKTTFINNSISDISSNQRNPFKSKYSSIYLYHVEFDHIFEQIHQQERNYDTSNDEFDHNEWKSSRHEAFLQVKQMLQHDGNDDHGDHTTEATLLPFIKPIIVQLGPEDRQKEMESKDSLHIIFVDDNMYYKSMRYSYYQLARRYRAGFVQIYIDCPLEECLLRNQMRQTVSNIESKKIVTSQVITGMKEKFEVPNPQENRWQSHFICISCTDGKDVRFPYEEVMGFWNDALPNDEPLRMEQESSREINLSSLKHQFDLKGRKIINNFISKFKSSENFDPVSAQKMGKEMSTKRQEIISSLEHLEHHEEMENLLAHFEMKFLEYCKSYTSSPF